MTKAAGQELYKNQGLEANASKYKVNKKEQCIRNKSQPAILQKTGENIVKNIMENAGKCNRDIKAITCKIVYQ